MEEAAPHWQIEEEKKKAAAAAASGRYKGNKSIDNNDAVIERAVVKSKAKMMHPFGIERLSSLIPIQKRVPMSAFMDSGLLCRGGLFLIPIGSDGPIRCEEDGEEDILVVD